MGEHTPTPWRLRVSGNIGNAIEAYSGKHYSELDDGYRTLATFQECCSSPSYADQQKNCAANGAFIVEAVNSYDRNRATIDALVGKLTVARNMLESYAEHDERIGHIEDAAFTSRVVAEIDAALPASKEGV